MWINLIISRGAVSLHCHLDSMQHNESGRSEGCGGAGLSWQHQHNYCLVDYVAGLAMEIENVEMATFSETNSNIDHELLYHDKPVKTHRFVRLDAAYNFFGNREIQNMLMKWSMKDQLQAETYAFVEPYNDALRSKFVGDFLRSDEVARLYAAFPGFSAADIGGKRRLKISPVECTVTSMEFFDPLLDSKNGVTREGHINKCMDEDIEGFVVADKLRKMLLDREFERYDLISESDRREFIFKLFTHLALGGQWCQYEDEITPYLTATKILYKDLVSLCRTKNDDLMITSRVMKIEVEDESGVCFPPKSDNQQNFVYFVVEPESRQLITLTHCFGGKFPEVT